MADENNKPFVKVLSNEDIDGQLFELYEKLLVWQDLVDDWGLIENLENEISNLHWLRGDDE